MKGKQMSKKTKEPDALACRRNKVGGQAVLEGVMMKSGERVCIAVRKPDGSIGKRTDSFVSVRKKHKILNIPILRGAINFVEMMKLSFSTLSKSGEMLGTEEEETRFEKWLREKFGKSIMVVIMPISIILALALSVGLFFLLPTYATKGIEYLAGAPLDGWLKSIIEGVMKIIIFICYLLLVSLMPDIKRTFMYHGSEHKSIFCYEHGLPLTVENVRTQRRFHPRCGTSFMFVMILIGVLIGILIPWDWANVDSKILSSLIRVGIKLLLLPLTCGVGYEFLMYAGKHDNALVRILSAPGLWMQRITTKEPDDSMIEVAIAALKGAMPEEFPEETTEDGAQAETEAEEKPGDGNTSVDGETPIKDGEENA
jgi:uncharacterized protein YqhQ